MAPEIENMIQEILDSSDEEKVDLAKRALSELIGELREGGIEDDAIKGFIIGITRLVVSADKDCTEKEYYFFKNVTEVDISYKEFYQLTDCGSEENFVKATFDVISSLSKESRCDVALYGIALLSSDDAIKLTEYSLIEKILTC